MTAAGPRRRPPAVRDWARRAGEFASSPWALLALGAALPVFELPLYRIGAYGDDTSYILQALSLAAGGYQDPSSPVPQAIVTYFPGLPLLLAPFAALASPHWDVLRAVPWLLSAVTSVLLWRLFRDRLTAAGGWMFLALWTLNPVRLRMSTRVMSEPAFLCAAVGAMAGLAAHERRPSPGRLAVVAGACLAAGALRPEGALLGAVCALALLHAGRRGAALAVLSAGVLPALGSYLRPWMVSGGAGKYESFLLQSAAIIGRDYGAFLRHIASYSFSVVKLAFAPGAGWLASPILMGAVFAAAVVLAAAGVRRLSRAPGTSPGVLLVAVLFPLSMGLVHWLWFNFDERYVLPLLPFLLFLVAAGVESLGRRGRILGAAAGALALAGCLHALISRWGGPRPESLNAVPLKTLAWMKRELPADAVVLSRESSMVRLHAGLPGHEFFRAEGLDEFKAGLAEAGVTHVLLSRPVQYIVLLAYGRPEADVAAGRRAAARFAASHPGLFEALRVDPSEEASVLRVRVPAGFKEAYAAYAEAVAAFEAGRRDQALRDLAQATALERDFPSAMNLKGLILWEAAPGEALKLFEGAARLDPDNVVFRANLARMLERAGEAGSAERQIREIRRIRGEEPGKNGGRGGI